MLKPMIEKLIEKQNLTHQEACSAVLDIVDGSNAYQATAFLALLRAKGETVEELIGMAKALRSLMVSVPLKYPVLDIVGTGGDYSNTFNISTGACLVASACGVKIAKHGNRSVSSLCGSADVLEALGINVIMSPKEAAYAIDHIGIGFMFAPLYHPALKTVAELRKGLSIRTVFNLMGPLLNPANASYRLIGVSRVEHLDLMAEAVYRLGTERSLVFHGNGLDELSCIGPVEVREVTQHGIKSWVLDPQALGLPRCTLQDLKGGDSSQNAAMLKKLLNGEPGSASDTIVLNAGAAIWTYGLADSIQKGILMAKESIKRGEAYKKLQQWRDLCLIFSQRS